MGIDTLRTPTARNSNKGGGGLVLSSTVFNGIYPLWVLKNKNQGGRIDRIICMCRGINVSW